MGLVQALGSAVSTVTQASISLTVPAPTTAGNTLVASCIQASGSGFTSVTDSKGNTWTKVKETKVSVGNSHTIASFVARDAAALAAGDTITLTSSVSTQYPVIVAYEFTPISGPADAITSAEDAGTSSSTYSIPGVPIPAGDHLLIGVLGESGSGRSQTPDGTWIKLGANGDAAPTFPRTVMSMWDIGNGGTLAASGTFSGAGRWCGHLLAFPTASAAVTQAAAGTAAVLSSVAGALAAVLVASGTVAGVSSAAGAVGVVRAPQAVTGTAASTSSVAGTVTALRPATGTALGMAAAAGTATALHPAAGATAAASAVGGSVAAQRVATATTPAQAAVGGSVTQLLRSSGSAPATSAVNGSPSLAGGPASIPATGAAPILSGATGTVRLLAALAGSGSSTSGTVGHVTLLASAAGSVPATSSGEGNPVLVGTTGHMGPAATPRSDMGLGGTSRPGMTGNADPPAITMSGYSTTRSSMTG